MNIDYFHKNLLFLLIFVTGLLMGHFLVYEPFIVPQMEREVSISIFWVRLSLLPGLLVLMVFGFYIKSKWDFIPLALLSGWFWALFDYLLAINEVPGYIKIYESTVDFLYRGLFLGPLEMMLFLLFGFCIRKLFSRKISSLK